MINTHGTNGGYSRGCRCDSCKNAHRKYVGSPQFREKENKKLRRRRKKHPELFRQKDRARYQRDKTRIKERERFYRFGLTAIDIAKLLEEQHYCCAICGTSTPGGRGDWHVDHDHKTGKIRGLLCHKCNVGLGCLGDSIDVLVSAISYLKESL
jgi:hypothetical protein